jgi:cell division protein FtsN
MPRPARQHAAPRRRSGGGFLLGAFIGLIIGLAIAVGVAFYLNKTPIPFLGKAKPAAKDTSEAAKSPVIAGMPQGGAAKPPGEKPKFDFYKILPGGEETVTDRQLKDAAKAAKAQPNLPKDVYYIQAGSFQNPADADNQKAKLAILGLESNVEPTTLPDKGTWYRVRLGPYTRLEDLNRVRQQLTQNGFDASLVKLKEPAVRTN